VNFSAILKRLRSIAAVQQRGQPPGKVVVDRRDLAELLHQFDSADNTMRRLHRELHSEEYPE